MGQNRLWVRFLEVSDIYHFPCSWSLRLLGSLCGSLGTYGLIQKLCWKKERWLSLLHLKLPFIFPHLFICSLIRAHGYEPGPLFYEARSWHWAYLSLHPSGVAHQYQSGSTSRLGVLWLNKLSSRICVCNSAWITIPPTSTRMGTATDWVWW